MKRMLSMTKIEFGMDSRRQVPDHERRKIFGHMYCHDYIYLPGGLWTRASGIYRGSLLCT